MRAVACETERRREIAVAAEAALARVDVRRSELHLRDAVLVGQLPRKLSGHFQFFNGGRLAPVRRGRVSGVLEVEAQVVHRERAQLPARAVRYVVVVDALVNALWVESVVRRRNPG